MSEPGFGDQASTGAETPAEHKITPNRAKRAMRGMHERSTLLFSLLGAVLSIILSYLLWLFIFKNSLDALTYEWAGPISVIAAIIVGGTGVISSILWAANRTFSEDENKASRALHPETNTSVHIDGRNNTVHVYSRSAEDSPDDPAFALLVEPDSQVEMLTRIYSHGLTQAKISFFVSIVFAAIGSSVLLYGVGLAVSRASSDGDQYAAIVSQTSGLVINLLASVFFLQSNRARKDMGEQGVMLRDDSQSERRLNAAGRVVDGISDQGLQDEVRAKMALKLVNIDPDASTKEEGLSHDPCVDARQ